MNPFIDPPDHAEGADPVPGENARDARDAGDAAPPTQSNGHAPDDADGWVIGGPAPCVSCGRVAEVRDPDGRPRHRLCPEPNQARFTR